MMKRASDEITPLASISVITYNQASFIRQALDSILMQETDFRFEICLGEHESSDGTREICQEYAQKFPAIIHLTERSQKNPGMRKFSCPGLFNFINNLQDCRGKYIAICDGDDYWTDPHKLQKQVDFLEAHSDYALCFSNGNVLYEDEETDTHLGYLDEKESVFSWKTPADTTELDNLIVGNYIYTHSVVFRNWFSKDPAFPDEFMLNCPWGDWALHLHTARYGKIKYMPDIMSTYRVHKGGVWSTETKCQQRMKEIFVYYWAFRCGGFPQKHRDFWLERSAALYVDAILGEDDITELHKFTAFPHDTVWQKCVAEEIRKRYRNDIEQMHKDHNHLRETKDAQLCEKDLLLHCKDVQIQEKETHLMSIQQSLSWRITRPLRMIHSILFRRQ